MKRLTAVLIFSVGCLLLVGCNGNHEEVVKEENKAIKEIGAAKEAVVQQQADSKQDIQDALAQGDLNKIEEAKIDATSKLAGAEKKVDEEKVAAVEAIAEAKRDAGESRGTFQRE